MTWIETIDYDESQGKLRKLYDRIKAPSGQIDNIMLAHSLRPHTMEGHMALYKNALHHSSNQIPEWFLEALGVYVSLLNGCDYCADHHFAGMSQLLGDANRSAAIQTALVNGAPGTAFSGAQLALMQYAAKLTRDPATLEENDVAVLREEGLSDGEILEANQVIAYFAYANRTVLGLGVNTKGEILGLSPETSDDTRSWKHG